MYPNMMNPMIQPYTMVPMMPMQPTTIKIEITPNGFQPQVQVEQEEAKKQAPKEEVKTSVYDMPKASVYEPKKAEEKVEEAKAEETVEEKTEE